MIGRDKKKSNFGPVKVKCLVKLADFGPKTLKTNLASKRQQPLLSDLGTVLLKHLCKAWSYAIIFNLNNYWTADPVKNVKTASNMNKASVTFSFIGFIQALNACLGLPFWVNAIVKIYQGDHQTCSVQQVLQYSQFLYFALFFSAPNEDLKKYGNLKFLFPWLFWFIFLKFRR